LASGTSSANLPLGYIGEKKGRCKGWTSPVAIVDGIGIPCLCRLNVVACGIRAARRALPETREKTIMEQIIIQLISGAVGGNAAGAVLKNLSMGLVGNSIAGAVGGGVLGQVLGAVAPMLAGGMGGQALGGGIGGLVLTAIAGFIKNKMAG
jgi:uncharacterized membrane protein YeaQ/YmgE (transglycosylase-associated protein family)